MVYVNWLSMVRAGLLGLEFYTPESKSWRQVTHLSAPLQQDGMLSANFDLMLSFMHAALGVRGEACRERLEIPTVASVSVKAREV